MAEQDFAATYERRQRASFNDALKEAEAVIAAITRIHDSVRVGSGSAGEHLAAGKLFEISNEISSAEKAYRRSLAIDPESLETHIRLIVVLLKQRRYAEAIDVGNELFLKAPDSIVESLVYRGPLSLCTVLGDAHRLSGDFVTASIFYREAARIEKGAPYSVNQAVICMAAAGEADQVDEFIGKYSTFVGDRVAAVTRLAKEEDPRLATVKQLAVHLAGVSCAEGMA